MPDLLDGAAQDDIAQQSMTVRGHRDQVAPLLVGGVQNFVGGIAKRQMRRDIQAICAQVSRNSFEIGPIVFHFLRFA